MFWIVTQCWVFDTCSTSYQGLLQPGSFNFDMTDSIFENVAQNFIWLFLKFKLWNSFVRYQDKKTSSDERSKVSIWTHQSEESGFFGKKRV
mgnify:FL=1